MDIKITELLQQTPNTSIKYYVAKYKKDIVKFTIYTLKDECTNTNKFLLEMLGFEECRLIDLFNNEFEAFKWVQTKILEEHRIY